jgi:hypothetical protein
VVPAGSVSQQAGSLFFLNPAIDVPPYQTGKAQQTCTLPSEIQLIDVVSHMHRFGTAFVATTDSGQTLYQTNDWEEPVPAQFQPALTLAPGTKITYTCSYQNTLGQSLSFGESAVNDEMCILSGTYYPAPAGKTLGCQ